MGDKKNGISIGQDEWLKEYEQHTGFVPLCLEDIENGTKTFDQVAEHNIKWFRDWSESTVRMLENHAQILKLEAERDE